MSDSRKSRAWHGSKGRTSARENIQKLHKLSSSAPSSSSVSPGQTNYNRGHKVNHCQKHIDDKVRSIVEEEGRTARNLIAYSVPLQNEQNAVKVQKPSKLWSPLKCGQQNMRSRSSDHCILSRQGKHISRDETPNKRLDNNQRRMSGSLPKKFDLRARYWAFLFDNLQRAVDEIYKTCEADESELECREAIMMLEQCSKDFRSLIDRLRVIKEFENADEQNKPTSLTWELRKTSPGKSLVSSSTNMPAVVEKVQSSPAQRALRFNNITEINGIMSLNMESELVDKVTGDSWADKVKGVFHKTTVSQTHDLQRETKSSTQDTDGWETVHNYKKDKTKLKHIPANKASVSKTTNGRIINLKQKSPSSYNSNSKVGKLSRYKSPSDSNLQLNISSLKDKESTLDFKSERCIVTAMEQERMEQICDQNKVNINENDVLVNGEIIKEVMHPNSDDDFQGTSDNVILDHPSGDLTVGNDSDDCLKFINTVKDSESVEQTSSLDKEIDDIAKEITEDDSLERENELAIQSAIQEEASFLQEIADCKENELSDEPCDSCNECGPMNWDEIVAEDEAHQKSLNCMSWGDQVEAEMDETRTPGRSVHMHEKLSSPSRKRSIKESQKRHEEKQAKAVELRGRRQKEQAERLRYLSNKVEEVRSYKNGLIQEKKEMMEMKLARADEIRRLQLKNKVKKAHEEETKAGEIAFINSLEAQNKKLDIMSKHQESEARLHDIIEERQRKHVEKAAMEAKAAERRRNLEAERMSRIQELQERRKQREHDAEIRQQEKEKERLKSAKAKEKEREQRIAALNAQKLQHREDLKHKIRQKQEESSRRHQETLDGIREKVFVMRHSTEDHNDAPNPTPFDTKKFCNVCNVLLPSEVHLLSHLRGQKHKVSIEVINCGKDMSKQDIESFNLTHIMNAPLDRPDPKVMYEKERMKSQKKRCKKLRQRMIKRGSEYEKSLEGKENPKDFNKAKTHKVLKDLSKTMLQQGTGPWPPKQVSTLDRGLGEIVRILEKKNSSDLQSFMVCSGFEIICNILSVIEKSTATLAPTIPTKSLSLACNVLHLACKTRENCHHLLLSNKIASLIDLLYHRLEILVPDNFNLLLETSICNSNKLVNLKLLHDPVATGLMKVISISLDHTMEHTTPGTDHVTRNNDVISYLVSVGIVDKLGQCFDGVRGPIDDNINASGFLSHSLALLCSMIRLITVKNRKIFEDKAKVQDPTQLITTFGATELFGIVSLLYGMLLHSDAPSKRDTQSPPMLPTHTLDVTMSALKMLNSMAVLDIKTFQVALSEEGTWLEFRHICSYLLWYCSHYQFDDLQHEVILCVGYFTVLNQDNQLSIQSGQPPTVLQQLCSLPFQYFSDPVLTDILFPTLIACCYNNCANRSILEHELSSELLSNYLEEKDLEAQQSILAPSKEIRIHDDPEVERRKDFTSRFPKVQWQKAMVYFQAK